MGSVAGRFGNPGQVDYAAANDALARMCYARPNSLHIDWTAWDDVGMAVRGGMRSLLEGRGVDLLPADAGASLLADLIGAKVTGELVVAGALGDFEPGPDHPLLDSLEVDGARATGTRVLTVARDRWIEDHAIEGTPVLPGVVGLELMAAVASALFEGQGFAGATGVSFEAPAKVYREEPTTLFIEAERIAPGRAQARLVSRRTLRTGREQRTEHFTATLVFGEVPPVEALPSAFLPDEPVDQAGIYRRFFHGPAFQVLSNVIGVSADGLSADGQAMGLVPGMITDALVVEAAFQAAGLHRMIVSHQMGLPHRVRAIQVVGRASPGEALSVVVRQVAQGYDIDVDAVGGPVLRMRGYVMIDRGPVPPPDRFPVPDRERPLSFPTSSTTGSVASGGSVIAEARADEDPHTWLTPTELSELKARGTERRVRDRIAGRVAAKRALSLLTGVAAHDMRVVSQASGEPLAEVPGHPSVRVSLSHREGRAVAVAVDAGLVGIDLERVETRPESFSRTWFDAEERQLTAGDAERETVAWAVKEAVLKLIGTGMACSPHDIKVRAIEPGSAMVEVLGEARQHLHARGGGAIRIGWATVGIGRSRRHRALGGLSRQRESIQYDAAMILAEIEDIAIRRIVSPEEAARWRAGFIGAYQTVFSGFPYFERFYPSEAEGIYRSLVRTDDNITLVATRGETQVVGFGGRQSRFPRSRPWRPISRAWCPSSTRSTSRSWGFSSPIARGTGPQHGARADEAHRSGPV